MTVFRTSCFLYASNHRSKMPSTPWGRLLKVSYTRHSSHFMEPEASKPSSQKSATCPYTELDEPSLCLIMFLADLL